MKLKSGLLASAASAAVLALVSPVQAGGYVSIFGGWNSTDKIAPTAGSNGSVNSSYTTTVTHTNPVPHPHTLTFNFTAVSNFANSGAEAENGWVVGAAVGGDLGHWLSGLRGEFELSYRRNNLGAAAATGFASDVDQAPSSYAPGGNIVHPCGITPVAPLGVVSGPPAPCTAVAPGTGTFAFQDTFTTGFGVASGSGSVRTFALMANAWFDFPVEHFTPYIGGGIGYASNEVEHGLVMNGNTGGFAWQVGGGVNFPIGEKTHLGIGYRYMDAGDVDLPIQTLNGPINTTHEVKHHSVQVNLTFDLGK